MWQSFLLEGTAAPTEAKYTVFYKNNYDKNIISMEDARFLRAVKITGSKTDRIPMNLLILDGGLNIHFIYLKKQVVISKQVRLEKIPDQVFAV